MLRELGTVIAGAVVRMWAEISEADPTTWKRETLAAAQPWRAHRRR